MADGSADRLKGEGVMALIATSRAIPRSLIGQKALVTGANSGIGRAVAVALGEAGADVVVNYVNQEGAAAEVVEEIQRQGVSAYAHKADVAREDEVQAMFARMLAQFGTIDILVANAGLQRDAPFHAMTLEQWNTVLDVNLTGQFLCAREALREFLRRGVVETVSCAAGKIICMSSVHQEIPWAGHANYAASKGGVMMMMRSLAQEVASHRIRVNGIAPGAVRTPINTTAWQTPEAYASLMQLVPYRRIGEPEDIARAAGGGQHWADTRDLVEPAACLVRSVPGQDSAIELQNLRLELPQLDPKSGNTRSCNLRDPGVIGSGNNFEQLFDPTPPNRRDDPKLSKMRANRVDGGGLLADKKMARAMKHQAALLLDRLDRNEPHVRPRDRLAYRLRIGRVILLSFDIRLHVGRRYQAHGVPKSLKLPRPIMR
jgi:glucose 1-dehydrogenase